MEGARMISEHQFASHYSSSWRAITPLGDGFWSVENMLTSRIVPPIAPRAPKHLRAVVNEAAFRAFCDLHGMTASVDRAQVLASIDGRLAESVSYVSRFTTTPPITTTDINDASRKEAGNLVLRLLHYFPGTTPAILRPIFPGCGLLSACEGDLIEGNCLYEVKAGDRAFRIADLRQLLIYAALAHASGAYTLTHIGLFNPRTGVAWTKSLDQVCLAVSGLRATDTLTGLVEQFSMASVSR